MRARVCTGHGSQKKCFLSPWLEIEGVRDHLELLSEIRAAIVVIRIVVRTVIIVVLVSEPAFCVGDSRRTFSLVMR